MWQPGMKLDEIEKMVILKAFQFFHGNKTQTANSLGIAVRTLDAKLKKYEDEKNGILSTESGLCVEPVDELPPEPTLPVRERQKVQEVSSLKNSARNKGRHPERG
jgi:hypothetical protein